MLWGKEWHCEADWAFLTQLYSNFICPTYFCHSSISQSCYHNKWVSNLYLWTQICFWNCHSPTQLQLKLEWLRNGLDQPDPTPENGRWPLFFWNRRRPQFFLDGRQPLFYFENGRRPQYFWICKTALVSLIEDNINFSSSKEIQPQHT
jgi:hypothetical protein